MSDKKIHIISGNDWTALYIDGRRVYQNHVLYDKDVLNALDGAGILKYTSEGFDDDEDHFPEELDPSPTQ